MHSVLLATSYPGGMSAIAFVTGWLIAGVGAGLGIIAAGIVLIGKRSRYLAPTLAAYSAVLALISLLSLGLMLTCEVTDPEVKRDKAMSDRMVKETIPLGVGSVVLMGIGMGLWGVTRHLKSG